jgi:succinyl-CoA synthetase beta subunit
MNMIKVTGDPGTSVRKFMEFPYIEQFAVLKKHGFKVLPYGVAGNENEAAHIAMKIGYPVAMKILSSEIEHKTDVGGVKVNIKNADALRIVYREIVDNAKTAGKRIDGILVQKMARKGIELIIGGKKDAQFGHMIVLGLGGIYVEIFRDVTARICPINRVEIEEMVGELKSHPLIDGARGAKPINRRALEDIIMKACRMMAKEDFKELDLNPVIFDHSGCDIVDVRFATAAGRNIRSSVQNRG